MNSSASSQSFAVVGGAASANAASGPSKEGFNEGLALGVWLFAGSGRGGERAAAVYTLIETAKLNGIDPQAWLADVLGRIHDHPAARLDQLLPWQWRGTESGRVAR